MGSTPPPRRHHISRPLPHPRLSSTTLPPRATVYVVERLGRYSRLLIPSSPTSPLLPLVDKVIAAYTTRLVDQSTPPQGLVALCSGRFTVTIHAHWTVRVLDPKRLAYRIQDVDRCVYSLVYVRVRDAFAALPPNALPSFANPQLLTTMSEGIRQSIDETSRKFGVECPSFGISTIYPSQTPPTRPQVLYYPQPVDPPTGNLKFPALPAPPTSQAQLPPPSIQNQRSLNLAAEPVAAPPTTPPQNDFETVLPELPGNSYPLNPAQPDMTVDEDGEESDNDRTSLEDSSVEDENTPPPDSDPLVVNSEPVNGKQASPKGSTKEVLYAPPPSPTPSQESIAQRDMQSPDILPEFVSRVLNSKPLAEEGTLLVTDSSYEDLPTPPVLTAPAHPISPPIAAPTEEDFTPSLAKYLDGLPPTPTVDLPPSETSDEVRDGNQQEVTTRETGGIGVEDNISEEGSAKEKVDGEANEDMQMKLDSAPHSSREIQEMDETEDVAIGSVAAESVLVSTVSSDLEKGVLEGKQGGIVLEHKPLETFGEQMKISEVDKLRSPPPQQILRDTATSTTVTRAVTESGSEPEDTAEAEQADNSFDSSDMEDLEARSSVMREQPSSIEEALGSARSIEHRDVTASDRVLIDEPASSSAQRDQRRKRLQTPTSSIFEDGGSGNLEPLPRRFSDGSVGERGTQQDLARQVPRMPVTRSLENVGEHPANTKRGIPLRNPRDTAQGDNGYASAKRIDLERKRNIAAMSDYQPAGKRHVPSPAHTFDGSPHAPGMKEARGPFIATQYPLDRRVQRSNLRGMGEMEHDPLNILGHRDISNNSDWQRTADDGASARKEQARRERIRKELDSIEKSQAEIMGGGDISSDEEHRRQDAALEDSDSEHDIFHDAYSERPPVIPVAGEHSHSRRHSRPRQRHRRNSRREEGFYAESSSSDEMCEECSHHRNYDYYDRDRSRRSRDRSRSKFDSSRRRVQDDDADRYSESLSEVRSTGSSRSRSRSDKRSSDGRRSDHTARERSRRSKGPSSRDRRSDRSEKSERSTSEKRSRESSKSRSKSSDRKRSHEKSSKSSKKSSREVEPEKRRREGKSKSKSKHRKPRSPPPSEYMYSQNDGGLKSIYRHRLPESDSGIQNPIPWYCEGQSAPEDTDVDTHQRYSSDSDTRGRRSGRKHTTVYSSYGQRDKRGRRRRAHHNRRVTFLYDNVTLTR